MNIEDRIKYTPQGFSYVEVSPIEVVSWGGECICNGCDRAILDDNMYLSFILTDTYCKDCWEDILKRQRRMPKEDRAHDLKIQIDQHLNWYRYHLDTEFRHKLIEKLANEGRLD